MSDGVCTLCEEPGEESRPTALAYVDDAERRWLLHLHPSCLVTLLRADLPPLAPDRAQRIPGDAACGVCGKRLPIVGRHPYAVSLAQAGAESTWFVHAECLPDAIRRRLPCPEGDPR